VRTIVVKISKLWVYATMTTILLQGCAIYDLINENEVTKDANKLFQRYNLTIESLSCKNLEGGTAAVCTFKLDSQQLQKWVNEAKLEHVYTNRSMDDLKYDLIALGEKAWKNPKIRKELDYRRRLDSSLPQPCRDKLRAETSEQIDLYGIYNGSTSQPKFELFYAKSIEKGCFAKIYYLN
jgi:hypothetical protein